MNVSAISRMKIDQGMLYLFFIISFFMVQPSSLTAQEDVLMVVHDREISKSEFLRLREKYYEATDTVATEDFLDLFIDFHLKVAHARSEGIQNEPSFRSELSRYRRELALPYLGDQKTEEVLAREAYERLHTDVNASHILVRLSPGYSPEDTLMAYEKAMLIRERIINGDEEFGEVAKATSDDPSAKNNSGNPGYFTALQMTYPFENQAYSAPADSLSMPVRTRFGYHIIRVNDRRPSRGEIRTAHLMIGFNEYDEEEARQKIREIHEDLLLGYDFEMMAQDYSTDPNTAGQGGILPWFGTGYIVPVFEEAAFDLEDRGDISEPVLTEFGWHIIKLLDKREIPPYDEIKPELVKKIRGSADERSELIKKALVTRLKKEWNFSENAGALGVFYNIVDSSIFQGNWTIPSGLGLNSEMFSLNGRKIIQKDFARFIAQNAVVRHPWPRDEYIGSLYEEFVAQWLIRHENENLEEKYPEFRILVREITDGMLLFEITDRVIWSDAGSDSIALADFHQKNRFDYMRGRGLDAAIFTTDNGNIAGKAARRASRKDCLFWNRDNDWVIKRFNRNSGEDVITYEEGVFYRGDREITDTVEWSEGVSEVISSDRGFQFVVIEEIIEPQPKTLGEAYDQVVSDYLEYLESEWVKQLHDKYDVVINEDVLSEIK